ncbi:hypothetical protein EUGRSUZ_C02608 [Eucalyptus grandis]|uniref:Uncharacterized protein n=2 Tax=Eucalyptus grandis TaxID=71139 RepID=A0A059CTG0_EUCGR|nr:hypothetical protein EUGRSUZ_C02608 [Eucalyptus grandis]
MQNDQIHESRVQKKKKTFEQGEQLSRRQTKGHAYVFFASLDFIKFFYFFPQAMRISGVNLRFEDGSLVL